MVECGLWTGISACGEGPASDRQRDYMPQAGAAAIFCCRARAVLWWASRGATTAKKAEVSTNTRRADRLPSVTGL